MNWHYDPHIKNAYAYQFNFGVQHQINNTTTITGSFVGSLTHRANVGGSYNTALQPSPLPNPLSRAMYPCTAPALRRSTIAVWALPITMHSSCP